MKHLRKYNESTSNTIDVEYLNLVFAEFIDDGAISDFNIEGEHRYWDIMIDKVDIKDSDNIDECIESIGSFYQQIIDIKSCIEKAKEEFPTINFTFGTDWDHGVHIGYPSYHIIFDYDK